MPTYIMRIKEDSTCSEGEKSGRRMVSRRARTTQIIFGACELNKRELQQVKWREIISRSSGKQKA